ncbi:MAG: NYN domain-containing protein [Nodosilinea sp.]
MIRSSTPIGSEAASTVGKLVLTTLYTAHQRYPHILSETCRNWLQKTSTEAQQQKILGLFEQRLDSAATLRALDQVVDKLFVPAFSGSKPHTQLVAAIHSLIAVHHNAVESLASAAVQADSPKLIDSTDLSPGDNLNCGLLLVDAENIHLPESLEQGLESIAVYPIRHRLAFGNWRLLGNRDQDFYRRGYQLVHVPSGKNSSDIKMSLDASLISLRNPAIREAFICSTDKDLLHLGYTLMNLGITPYRVSQHQTQMVIENLAQQTSHTVVVAEHVDPPDPAVRVPTLAQMKSWLKTLIKQAQQAQPEQPVTVGHLGKLFRDRNQISPSQVLKAHGGHKNLTEFLAAHEAFVLTPLPDSSQVIVTLRPSADQLNTADSRNSEVGPGQIVAITNPKRLEQALIEGIQTLSSKAESEYIDLSSLCSHFALVNREPISQVLNRIGESKNLPKFLAKCPTIRSRRQGKNWKVALASETS